MSQVADNMLCVCVCNWQEERLRRGDDLRLQMAIEESKREKLKPEEVGVKFCCFLSLLAFPPPAACLSPFTQFSLH